MDQPWNMLLLFLIICLQMYSGSTTPGETHGETINETNKPTTQGPPNPNGNILEDESDNQENILSQLLGDYDKVKAIAEGSNCKCKCVVKPLSRDSCESVSSGHSHTQDFYTVETITSGPDCKCACVAPPSALNPCEGEFRLKKLRETENNGFKLSTIIEMLEGAFYGLDLLKLHTVTTKIIGRVEKIEEVISKNLTKEQEQIKGSVDEILTEMQKKEKENCTADTQGVLSDIGKTLQRDAAAAYMDNQDKYEEKFIKDEQVINPKLQAPSLPQQVKRSRLSQRQIQVRPKPAPKPSVIRGVTFYKAKDTDNDSDLEDQPDEDLFSGDNSIDMFIEDQLIKHNIQDSITTEEPSTSSRFLTSDYVDFKVQTTQPEESTTEPAISISNSNYISEKVFTSDFRPLTTKEATTEPPVITEQTTAMQTPTTTVVSTTKAIEELPVDSPSVKIPVTGISLLDPVTSKNVAVPTANTKFKKMKAAKQNTDENKGEEDDVQKVIGRCKDTLSTISGPTTHNTYGRNEGAWMKDALAKDEKIYVTNYYYGNTLVEFRNIDNFKQGRWSNSYKLPYSWIGTGHVVYNGSFYYNRAFTRNIIKYDLKHRYVAAWSLLHDVVYEESTPWRWRGHSDIDFAIDENGLWVIYPAIDDEGFQQEVIVLSKLNSVDLTTKKETTWRTGLRKDFYGNCFVICGVLYAVDSYNKKNANISYAFDTHTNTQIVPRLLFVNEYSYTTQIDYNPKDRLLYTWDNGHQVTYQVIFAY
ncbi:hypothetical protein GDO86_007561 [Hymenochirus boettgeri]|uniref:Olfactomedin-like domain-containing protein n=1 Tax=Hymenochirus boettgeri TaxID=247094 RepID=A0A8T2IZF3_9PIPI|nr:hypothetical protein GDO86_007561 [Hymenochirus boettgeri]